MFVVEAQTVQVGLPGGPIGEVPRPGGQRGNQGQGQFLLGEVGQRHFVDHLVLVAAAQHLQEVDPALAGGAVEVSEEVVADVSAVALLPFVAGHRVIGVDVRGGL